MYKSSKSLAWSPKDGLYTNIIPWASRCKAGQQASNLNRIKGSGIMELKNYSNMNIFKCPPLITTTTTTTTHHSLISCVFVPSITNLLYVCHTIFSPWSPNRLLSGIFIFKPKVIPLLPFVNTYPNHCILIGEFYCVISTFKSCHLLSNNL